MNKKQGSTVSYPDKTSKWMSNFLAFQIGWFACAYWHDGRSVVVVAMMLLWLYHSEPWSKIRIYFTVKAAMVGLAFDLLLTFSGVLKFDPGLGPIPYWLVLLWFLFASSLSVSLKWLMENRIFAMVAGLLLGPAAYWAGEQFGALSVQPLVNFSWGGYLVMGIGWSVMMAIFSGLYRRLPINEIVLCSHDRGDVG
jgi:hypothetical protein